MSFQDVFKNSFLEEFTTITVQSLLTAVILAFLLGVFIVFIYRMTYSGAMFNKSFAFSLVLLSMVTSVVILTISSNVVLSLGMVGALSIVRFRTAVKEPLDTVFMFWAIVAGLITGAGYVPVAVIATLLIGLLFLAMHLAGVSLTASAYLVVLRYPEMVHDRVQDALKSLPRHKVKSQNMAGQEIELVLEMKLTTAQLEKTAALRQVEGVREVNLISYNGATML